MVLPARMLQLNYQVELQRLLIKHCDGKYAQIYLALDSDSQCRVRAFLQTRFSKKQQISLLAEVLEEKLYKKVTLETFRLRNKSRPKKLSYLPTIEQLIAFMLLLALLPLVVILMILIKLNSDPGPCLYHQERVGLFGKSFKMTKFRSMKMNAEAKHCPQWASYPDPRSTKIGEWLRRTHLDEIPQLWQVVLGQMSFIGPRPERPHYVEKLSALIPEYALRHTVKPGITGLAQVKYCYAACFNESKEKLSYDLYYIQHQSYWLDIYILLATVNKVFLKGDLFKFA